MPKPWSAKLQLVPAQLSLVAEVQLAPTCVWVRAGALQAGDAVGLLPQLQDRAAERGVVLVHLEELKLAAVVDVDGDRLDEVLQRRGERVRRAALGEGAAEGQADALLEHAGRGQVDGRLAELARLERHVGVGDGVDHRAHAVGRIVVDLGVGLVGVEGDEAAPAAGVGLAAVGFQARAHS